jgi:hypothetical protein
VYEGSSPSLGALLQITVTDCFYQAQNVLGKAAVLKKIHKTKQ